MLFYFLQITQPAKKAWDFNTMNDSCVEWMDATFVSNNNLNNNGCQAVICDSQHKAMKIKNQMSVDEVVS